MTKILFIDGRDGFEALEVERNIGIDEVVAIIEKQGFDGEVEGEKEYFIEYDDEDKLDVRCVLMEFGDIDLNFIQFIHAHFMDYDMMKGTNFYVIDNNGRLI